MMMTRRIEVRSGLCFWACRLLQLSRLGLGSDILVDLRGGPEVVGDENCKGKGKGEDVLNVNEQNIKNKAGRFGLARSLSGERFLGFFLWGNALVPKIIGRIILTTRLFFFY